MKKIEINPTNEYHLLRHFKNVNEKYSNELIDKEYYFFNHKSNIFEKSVIKKKDITNALNTKGSKFFKNISGIENPKKLLRMIKEEFERLENIEWKQTSNGKIFSFMFKYKFPVGFKNLIPIKGLTENEKLRVKKVARGENENSIKVNTIERVELKEIDTIEVGILDSVSLPFLLVTAYPGDLTATEDFPNNNQNIEDYEKSKIFWDSHVFVEA